VVVLLVQVLMVLMVETVVMFAVGLTLVEEEVVRKWLGPWKWQRKLWWGW